MTKSKTILAGLGVVAALGVAALPLASYATITPASVSGNVQLAVEVQPAIAMTIVGNNDGGLSYSDGTSTYHSVDDFNPAAIASTPETTEGAGDGVTRTLDSHNIPTARIQGLSSSYTAITPNTAVDGSTTGFKSTITVYTNSTSGYTVGVEDEDSVTALVHEDGTSAGTIAAGTSIQAGTANWAYKGGKTVTESADVYTFTDNNNWRAMSAKDSTTLIYGSNTKTSGGDSFDIAYGVSTGVDQATGVYTDTIIYTATTK